MAIDNEQPPNPNQKGNKMFICFVWNCAIDIKLLLLSALLFLSSLVAVFQLSPSSVRGFRPCASLPPPSSAVDRHTPIAKSEHAVVDGGLIKRSFNGYGSAAYSFVLMSAYRGGGDTFAVVGLSSKPLHLFSKPKYLCQWIPHNATENHHNITVSGHKILPDWGFGRVYTVVVVNCTFPFAVGHDGAGGRLLLHSSTSAGGDTIEALTEPPGSLNTTRFNDPPEYEYLYCGSPLFGNLSPQRVREWIAYHSNLFGDKSHFVLYDAGGVHRDVMSVLRPWVDKGYVTLHDVNEEGRFDGYYHNQFLMVNDCLHRYKFRAKWMFFFDVDEFIYVANNATIKSVTDSLAEFAQFTIQQRTMSSKLCYMNDDDDDHHHDDAGRIYRKWGIEKLVYRDTKRGIRRDRKYAIQPRNVFATGVHVSQNLKGKTLHKTGGKIMYYHYHGVISDRREACRQLVNKSEVNVEGTPYVVDTTMREAAGAVKRFELRMIGPVLQNTHQ